MRVFIATLRPPRPGGNRTIGQIYIDDYNNRMRALAASEGAVLVDVYAGLLPDVTRYVGVDGLHPTEAGYAKIADLSSRPFRAISKCGSLSPFAKATGDRRRVVIAEHLTRVFDDRVAVRDVSLSVNAGEIVTLLGPNGAGKTTTMRMLAGLILPTAGRISIDGIELADSTAARARGSVGLLTEAPGLWERLSVRINLLTYARLHGLPIPPRASTRLSPHVDLLDRSNEIAGKLSKGLKQRVAIARALDPQAAGAAARRADIRPRSGQRAAHSRPDPGTAIRRPRHPGVDAQPGRGRGAIRSDWRPQD